LTLKILWDPETEKVLGAQAVGSKGVDKRLDVLATALRGGLTIEDLVHLELAYAPPFGGAKDPVNIAGFVACNDRDGLVDPVHSLDQPEAQVVDIRPPALVERDPVEGAVNIPLPQLRSSLERLDRSRPVITVCALGKTSYFAARILEQNGFEVKSYSGGIRARANPFTLYKPPQG
jgi:rhodanese-related sulfurtransferase